MDVNLEELAWRICGYTEQQAEEKMNEMADIDEELMEKFNIDSHIFKDLIEKLSDFTYPLAACVSKDMYQGFVDIGTSRFLYKKLFARNGEKAEESK